MNYKLKIGMYVQCPVLNADHSEVLLFGQVTEIIEQCNSVVVAFHDTTKSHAYSEMYHPCTGVYQVDKIQRACARKSARVKIEKTVYVTISTGEEMFDNKGFRLYYLEPLKSKDTKVLIVDESKLIFCMADGNIDVLNTFCRNINSNPEWVFNRNIISEAASHLSNAPKGFKNILSSRINIYPHQIDTVIHALDEKPCRLMLADEVGLGKTIEACAILKGMQSRNYDFRVFIVVPDELVEQWYHEIKYRFKLKPLSTCSTSISSKPGYYIIPYKSVNDRLFAFSGVCNMLIIDEAHKLLHMEYAYKKLTAVSAQAENVLLLSATPIMKDSQGYYKLMSLLTPDKYCNIGSEQFTKLLSIQNQVSRHLNSVCEDLPEYLEYEELKEEFIDSFHEIYTLTNDNEILNYIESINTAANSKSELFTIKVLIEYIKHNYCLGTNIIRHRKIEVAGAAPRRILKEIIYEPAGEAESYFETESIESITACFKAIFSTYNDVKTISDCKKLLQATSSSPYAVLDVLRAKNVPTDIPGPFGQYFAKLEKWRIAVDKEIQNIRHILQNPQLALGKISKIICWIENEDPNHEKKFLIFSQYTGTANKYAEALKMAFGEDSTALFLKGTTGAEIHKITESFQNNQECRFLVCDSSGGEGRNFQMADYIVHTDISWSPAIMEQRIGRLDRIGREQNKDVISVVIHSDYGIENDLFNVYNAGLGVFSKSLCGMEIAFDDIQGRIDNAFVEDPEHGLSNIVEIVASYVKGIESEIAQEMYYKSTKQVDGQTSSHIDRLLEYFELSNDDNLSSALRYWISAVGYTDIKRENRFFDSIDTLTLNVDHYNIETRKKYVYALPFVPDITNFIATFSRKDACKHDNLYFIAPSNAFYDTLSTNASQRPEGVSARITLKCNIDWIGFICRYNVEYNYKYLIDADYDIEEISTLTNFILRDQIQIAVNFPDNEVVKDKAILSEISVAYTFKNASNAETASFDSEKYSDEEIYAYAKSAAALAVDEALKLHLDTVNQSALLDFIENLYIKKSIANNINISAEKYISTLAEGIIRPIISLDSIILLNLHKG